MEFISFTNGIVTGTAPAAVLHSQAATQRGLCWMGLQGLAM